MKLVMIGCDNPACNNTGIPEEGGSKRKPNPPYGWLFVKGGNFGSGPYFDLVVCSDECLVPAIADVPS